MVVLEWCRHVELKNVGRGLQNGGLSLKRAKSPKKKKPSKALLHARRERLRPRNEENNHD